MVAPEKAPGVTYGIGQVGDGSWCVTRRAWSMADNLGKDAVRMEDTRRHVGARAAGGSR